jgi:hypothetical protein
MMNQKKPDQKIINDLFSANPEKVIHTINRIKEIGNKDYLPALFDLLLSNPDTDVKNEIEIILGTIKDKSSVSLFVEALQNEKYKTIQKSLLMACWQNGLDYSLFLPVFVNLVINENWETAFEAFTVIENMEFLPEDKTIAEAELKIQQALPSATGQNEYFLKEILAHISSF